MICKRRLKDLREKHGYTQKQIGDLLNISRTGYGYYEDEQKKCLPSIETVSILAKLYNTTADYIIGLSSNENPNDDPYTENEKRIIELYRLLSEREQGKIEGTLETLVEHQKKTQKNVG